MLKRILFFFSVISFASCAQLTSLQTAKVVGKDNVTLGGGAFAYGLDDKNAAGGEISGGVLPHIEVGGRYGLSNSFDMGLKLSTSSNVLLDGKFQFAGNQESQFAAAIGGGFEWQLTAGGFDTQVLRTHLPIYFSFHPNEKSGIYIVPRYVYQYVSDNDNSYFLGSGLGFQRRFSPNFSGMIEGSFFLPNKENSNNSGESLYLLGVGGVYHFGD